MQYSTIILCMKCRKAIPNKQELYVGTLLISLHPYHKECFYEEKIDLPRLRKVNSTEINLLSFLFYIFFIILAGFTFQIFMQHSSALIKALMVLLVILLSIIPLQRILSYIMLEKPLERNIK